MCLGGLAPLPRLPRCPAERSLRRAGATLPRLRCRAGLFERHEQQAGEFLGAEAVGAGGEFAKLALGLLRKLHGDVGVLLDRIVHQVADRASQGRRSDDS